jgi:hypothetical protein
MAFDPTLPATGVTKFGDLYAILRANFVALATPEAWTDFTPVSGSAYDQCSYRKDPSGLVHLKGHIMASDPGYIYQSLPEAYQPAQKVIVIGAAIRVSDGAIYGVRIEGANIYICEKLATWMAPSVGSFDISLDNIPPYAV